MYMHNYTYFILQWNNVILHQEKIHISLTSMVTYGWWNHNVSIWLNYIYTNTDHVNYNVWASYTCSHYPRLITMDSNLDYWTQVSSHLHYHSKCWFNLTQDGTYHKIMRKHAMHRPLVKRGIMEFQTCF